MTITARACLGRGHYSSASVEPASAASLPVLRAAHPELYWMLWIYMHDLQDGETAEEDSEVEDPGLTDIISRS